MSGRTPAQVIDGAEDVVLARESSPEALRQAGHILSASTRRLQECLRWACTVAVGVRGGWRPGDYQRVLAAAARGENWEAVRDSIMASKHR